MSETNGTVSNLGPLYAALAKARLAFPPITRSRTVTVRSDKGNYTFDYAPLDTIFAATVKPLADNGLVLTQLLEGTELVTKLGHESGVELVSRVAVPQSERIQQLGSAITYMRRYTAQAMLGLAAEEDDDGNAQDGNVVEHREDRAPEPPDPRMLRVGPFGSAPNQVVGALTDKEAAFYLNATLRAIEDPDKARWKAKNEALRDALTAEKERRAATQEAPFVHEGPPALAGPTEKDRAPLMKEIKALEKTRQITDDERKVLGRQIVGAGESLAAGPVAKLVELRDFLDEAEAVAKWREVQAKGAA